MALHSAKMRARLTRRRILEDNLSDNNNSWVLCTLLWRNCLQGMSMFESELTHLNQELKALAGNINAKTRPDAIRMDVHKGHASFSFRHPRIQATQNSF